MNPLSNIRIGPRLAIGFAIVLSLSVVSTSCALLSARDNAEATKLMMEQPLAKERLVSDWFTLNYSSMARTSMIAKSSDDALSATFADTIADTSKKISLLQEQISGLLSGDEEKTIYRDLVGARGAYLNAKTRVMEAKKAGDAAAAEHIYLDVFVPAAAAYQAKVQALLANQRKAINDTALSIEQANTRSFTLLVALSMLLIALGTVCAFLISRSITRPLRGHRSRRHRRRWRLAHCIHGTVARRNRRPDARPQGHERCPRQDRPRSAGRNHGDSQRVQPDRRRQSGLVYAH